MTAATFIRRYLSYPLQGLFGHIFFFLVRLLPRSAASGIGGKIGRLIGPRIAITRRARRNLGLAFPDKTSRQIELIIEGMWDNLGRVLFEYPSLSRIDIRRDVEIIGAEHLDALRDDGKPGILFGGHFANWEIAPLASKNSGLDTHIFYRAPNNPYVGGLFTRSHLESSGKMIPKGPKGARHGLKVLGQGGHLGMLVDQKMNDGIAVPLFGRDAMTAPALAQFALKYDCPVVAIRIERLHGVKFRITIYPPMIIENTGDRHADIHRIMIRVNETLEEWIRARPEQWLWLHNRWPD